jgi:hypothetical protein
VRNKGISDDWKNFKKGSKIKVIDNSDRIIDAYFITRRKIGTTYSYCVQLPRLKRKSKKNFIPNSRTGNLWYLNESRIVSESNI